jgi:hypothetical protein
LVGRLVVSVQPDIRKDLRFIIPNTSNIIIIIIIMGGGGGGGGGSSSSIWQNSI